MLTWQAFDKLAAVNLMMLCWPDYQARSTTTRKASCPRETCALFAWACFAYKSYFFSQRIIFFSPNKSGISTFSHGLSDKRTGQG